MTQSPSKLLIAAAGTGGHIFPALAVADHLKAQGVEITWCGTPDRMEATLIPQHGYPIELIHVKGLRGKNPWQLLKGAFLVWRSFWQAWRILGKLKPDLVLAMGGFVCGPVGLAAKLRRIPLIVHEQNSVVGLTNNVLARFATKILAAFPNAFPAPRRALLTGNPVRSDLVNLPTPSQRFSARTGPLSVLVLGGSQGARALNERLPQAFAKIQRDHNMVVEVWHQTGRGASDAVAKAYKAGGISAKVSEFIDDMAAAYAGADLLIGRAGALTVAEVATVGLPALFIPFPLAVDDHQYLNAKYLVEQGAAKVLRQQELAGEALEAVLAELLQSREHLLAMANNAVAHSHKQATEVVAAECQEVIQHA